MSYINAKEYRVEKEWNKRGVAGLRSSLINLIIQGQCEDWDDPTFVKKTTYLVLSILPLREFNNASVYILETIHLAGVEPNANFFNDLMIARLLEETLREDIGDE